MYIKGFHHEPTRPDREDYLTFKSVNINGCNADDYEAYLFQHVSTYGFSYDYCSIMHYPARQDSCIMTPKYAISCTVQGQQITSLGLEVGLSETDIQELNARYDCAGGKNKFFVGQLCITLKRHYLS